MAHGVTTGSRRVGRRLVAEANAGGNIAMVANKLAFMSDGTVGDGATPIHDTIVGLATAPDSRVVIMRQGRSLAEHVAIVATEDITVPAATVECVMFTDASTRTMSLASGLTAGATVQAGAVLYELDGVVPAPSANSPSGIITCTFASVTNAGGVTLDGTNPLLILDTISFRAQIVAATEVATGAASSLKVVAKAGALMADGSAGDGASAIHQLESATPIASSTAVVFRQSESVADVIAVLATGTSSGLDADLACRPVEGTAVTMAAVNNSSTGDPVFTPGGVVGLPDTNGAVASITCMFWRVTNAGGLTYDGTNAIQVGTTVTFHVLFTLGGREVDPAAANWAIVPASGAVLGDGSLGTGLSTQASLIGAEGDLAAIEDGAADARVVLLKPATAVSGAIRVVAGGDIGGLTMRVGCVKTRGTAIKMTASETLPAGTVAGGDDLFGVSGDVQTPTAIGDEVVECRFLEVTPDAGTDPALLVAAETPVEVGDRFYFKARFMPATGSEIVSGNIQAVAKPGALLADGASEGSLTTRINDTIANLASVGDGKVVVLRAGEDFSASMGVVPLVSVGAGLEVVLSCSAAQGTAVTLTSADSAEAFKDLFSAEGTVVATTSVEDTVTCTVIALVDAGTTLLVDASTPVALGDTLSFRALFLPAGSEVQSTANFKLVAKPYSRMLDLSPGDGTTTLQDTVANLNSDNGAAFPDSRVLILYEGEYLEDHIDVVSSVASLSAGTVVGCRRANNTRMTLAPSATETLLVGGTVGVPDAPSTQANITCVFIAVDANDASKLTRDGNATNYVAAGDTLSFRALFVARVEVLPSANFALYAKAGSMMADGSTSSADVPLQDTKSTLVSGSPPLWKTIVLREGEALSDKLELVALTPIGVTTPVAATLQCDESNSTQMTLTLAGGGVATAAGDPIFAVSGTVAESDPISLGMNKTVTCTFVDVANAGEGAALLVDGSQPVEQWTQLRFGVRYVDAGVELTTAANFKVVISPSALRADGTPGDGTTAVQGLQTDAATVVLQAGDSMDSKIQVLVADTAIGDSGFVVEAGCEQVDGTTVFMGGNTGTLNSGWSLLFPYGQVQPPSVPGTEADVKCTFLQLDYATADPATPVKRDDGTAAVPGDFFTFRVLLLDLTEVTTQANFKVVARVQASEAPPVFLSSGRPVDGETALQDTLANLEGLPTRNDQTVVIQAGVDLSTIFDVVAIEAVGQAVNITGVRIVCTKAGGATVTATASASAAQGASIISLAGLTSTSTWTSDDIVSCLFLEVGSAGDVPLRGNATEVVRPGTRFSFRVITLPEGNEVIHNGLSNWTLAARPLVLMEDASLGDPAVNLIGGDETAPSNKRVVLRAGQPLSDAIQVQAVSLVVASVDITCLETEGTVLTLTQSGTGFYVAGDNIFTVQGQVAEPTSGQAVATTFRCYFIKLLDSTDLHRSTDGSPTPTVVSGDFFEFDALILPEAGANEVGLEANFKFVIQNTSSADRLDTARGTAGDNTTAVNDKEEALSALSDNSEKIAVLYSGDKLSDRLAVLAKEDISLDGDTVNFGCLPFASTEMKVTFSPTATANSAVATLDEAKFVSSPPVSGTYVNVECIFTYVSSPSTASKPLKRDATNLIVTGDRLRFRVVVLTMGVEVGLDANFKVVARQGVLMADGSTSNGSTPIHGAEAVTTNDKNVVVFREGDKVAVKVNIVATEPVGTLVPFSIAAACIPTLNTLITLTPAGGGVAGTGSSVLLPSGTVGAPGSAVYKNIKCVVLKAAQPGNAALRRDAFSSIAAGDTISFRVRFLPFGSEVVPGSSIKVIALPAAKMADETAGDGTTPLQDKLANLSALPNGDPKIVKLKFGDDISTTVSVVAVTAVGTAVASAVDVTVACQQVQGTEISMDLASSGAADADEPILNPIGTVSPPTGNGGYLNITCTFLTVTNTGTPAITIDGTTPILEGDRFSFRAYFQPQKVVASSANFRVVAKPTAVMGDGSVGDGITPLQDLTTRLESASYSSRVVVFREGADIADLIEVIAMERVGDLEPVSLTVTCQPKQNTTIGLTLVAGKVDTGETLLRASGTVALPTDSGVVEQVLCELTTVTSPGSEALRRDITNVVTETDVIAFPVLFLRSAFEMVAGKTLRAFDGSDLPPGATLGASAGRTVLLFPGEDLDPTDIQLRVLAQDGAGLIPDVTCYATTFNAVDVTGTPVLGLADDDPVGIVASSALDLPPANTFFSPYYGYYQYYESSSSSFYSDQPGQPDNIACDVNIGDSWEFGDTAVFAVRSVPTDSSNGRFRVVSSNWAMRASMESGELFSPSRGETLADSYNALVVMREVEYLAGELAQVEVKEPPEERAGVRCFSSEPDILPDMPWVWIEGREDAEEGFRVNLALPVVQAGPGDDVRVRVACMGGGEWEGSIHSFTVVVRGPDSGSPAFAVVAGPQARGVDGALLGNLQALGFTNEGMLRLEADSSQHMDLPEGLGTAGAGDFVKITVSGPTNTEAVTIRCEPMAYGYVMSPFDVVVPAGTAVTSFSVALPRTGAFFLEEKDAARFATLHVTVDCRPQPTTNAGNGNLAESSSYKFGVLLLAPNDNGFFVVAAAQGAILDDAAATVVEAGSTDPVGVQPGSLVLLEEFAVDPLALELVIPFGPGTPGAVECRAQGRYAAAMAPFSVALDGTEEAQARLPVVLPPMPAVENNGALLSDPVAGDVVLIGCVWMADDPTQSAWSEKTALVFALRVADVVAGRSGPSTTNTSFAVAPSGPALTPSGLALLAAFGDEPAFTLLVNPYATSREGELAVISALEPPALAPVTVRCQSSAEEVLPSFSVEVPVGAVDVPIPLPPAIPDLRGADPPFDALPAQVQVACFPDPPTAEWVREDVHTFTVQIGTADLWRHATSPFFVVRVAQSLTQATPAAGMPFPPYNGSYEEIPVGTVVGDDARDAPLIEIAVGATQDTFLEILPYTAAIGTGASVTCTSSRPELMADVGPIPVTAVSAPLQLPPILDVVDAPVEVHYVCADNAALNNGWNYNDEAAVHSFTVVIFTTSASTNFTVQASSTVAIPFLSGETKLSEDLGHSAGTIIVLEDTPDAPITFSLVALVAPDTDVNVTCTAAGRDRDLVLSATTTVTAGTEGEIGIDIGAALDDSVRSGFPRFICAADTDVDPVWTLQERVTFTVAVRDTSKTNESFEIVAGNAAVGAGGALPPGTTLRDSAATSISLDELQASGVGDLLRVRVATEPVATQARRLLATTLEVECKSNNTGVMPDFIVDVDTLTFDATTDVLLPEPLPVTETTEVQYSCSPTEDYGSWTTTDVHTFTVTVGNTNSNANFAVVSGPLALSAQTGLFLDDDSVLGEYLSSDVIRVQEGTVMAPGDFLKVEVLVAPTLQVGDTPAVLCVSDTPAVVANFDVPLAGTNVGDKTDAPVAPGITVGEVTADVFVTVTCNPNGDYGAWLAADVHRFKIQVTNGNTNSSFEIRTSAALVLDAGGATTADEVLWDTATVVVAGQATASPFGRVVRLDGSSFALDMFCASSDTSVHSGFVFPIGAVGDTPFDLPESKPLTEDRTVTFTCRADRTTLADSSWSVGDQQHRFRVKFTAGATTNGSFTVLSGADEVGVDVDAVPVNERTTLSLSLSAKQANTAAFEVVCESGKPDVLSKDGQSKEIITISQASIAAGGTVAFSFQSQNVAATQTVTVTCTAKVSGDWNPTDRHVFQVEVTAGSLPNDTFTTLFEIQGGAYTYNSIGGTLASLDGNKLDDTTSVTFAAEGARYDSSGEYGLAKLSASALTSGSYRVLCSSSEPDVIPSFVSPEVTGAGTYDLVIGPGKVILDADADIRMECMPVTDGQGGPVNVEVSSVTTDISNEAQTFTIRMRKQRIRALAGGWAFDAFTGRRMMAKGHVLDLTAETNRVLVTAQSSLVAGDIAYLQGLEEGVTVAVSCNSNPDNPLSGDIEVSNLECPPAPGSYHFP